MAQQMDQESDSSSSSSSSSSSPKLAPSHDTALCLIPPRSQISLWQPVNRVRSLHDRASARWPPHINLVYPFVQQAALPEVAQILCQLQLEATTVSLTEVGSFSHKSHSTIFLRPAAAAPLARLRSAICRALAWPVDDAAYQPHMTVGQSDEAHRDAHMFFLEKARLLMPLSWDVTSLAILVREPSPGPDGGPRRMSVWAQLDLDSRQLITGRDAEAAFCPIADNLSQQPRVTYHFNGAWGPVPSLPPHNDSDMASQRLILASYNVLAEFKWPPDSSRYPALVANILSTKAAADVIVLQEVTDHFLSFLLENPEVAM
ncbi:hypothetical protein CDD83_9933 [Cordyceps sp. RAO-2017]|nr:hypothetical protein CDD83_9933 [Cordyceps sp. RAO-2017]